MGNLHESETVKEKGPNPKWMGLLKSPRYSLFLAEDTCSRRLFFVFACRQAKETLGPPQVSFMGIVES